MGYRGAVWPELRCVWALAALSATLDLCHAVVIPPRPKGAVQADAPFAGSCTDNATWKTDVIVGSGQMAPVIMVSRAFDCCERCATLVGCACWTFVTSEDPHKSLQCILKSAAQCIGSKQKSHRVSGSSTPIPPPPPSPPPPSPPPPSPGPPPTQPSHLGGGTRYKSWASVQGANYVPSYSVTDVKDIFRPGFWNASVIDRELSFAKKMAVNSLRVFVSHGGYASDNATAQFVQNYVSFQRLALSHNLTLMITLGTGERAPMGMCNVTTDFVTAIVDAEVAGAVIAYEADNEPTSYMFSYLINCTLPALFAASRNPNVDISVGVAHVGEVNAFKDYVTTLNWHSYNGKDNGGGLQEEINEVRKYMNKFNPPKELIVTEWLARPAQPLASALPVLRDSGVPGYAWALVIVDCTSHWNRPIVPGDPPFQGMIWPNGTSYDDIEEAECMLHQCRTLQYVHHCCNNPHANGEALDALWKFSGAQVGSDWENKTFGSPEFKLPGPREGSMRWTNVSGASVVIGPLPKSTKRALLYLASSSEGASFTVQLDSKQIYSGTTHSEKTEWVTRINLPVDSGQALKVTAGDTAGGTSRLSIYGITFFSTP